MKFESKFLSNKQAKPIPKLLDTFDEDSVYCSGDRLKLKVAGAIRLAKAGLSRLLTHFKSNVDFMIITPYRLPEEGETQAEVNQINEANFKEMPRKLRTLLGTAEVGAFELFGHWSERKGPKDTEGNNQGSVVETTERSWFFVNGDPETVSPQDLHAAAVRLGSEYKQTAFIIRLNGVTTLETPQGDVWNTLTTDNGIEKAFEGMMKAKYEFENKVPESDTDPSLKRQGWGYSEITRLKNKHDKDGVPTRGDASKFFMDDAPAKESEPAGEETEKKEEPKTASFQSFVSVPGSMGDLKYFAHLGMNHPGWKW